MGRSNPKVSVIMPVYNVDRYVTRAIESLRNQTLSDIEIIVVDDGSTDRSGQVVDHIAERDIRLEVFHTQNQGAPAARNLALDHASGTYVYFMDADDWAEPAMLADMVEMAEAHALELVVAGFHIDTYYGDQGEHLDEVKSHPTCVYVTQEDFRRDAYRLFDKNLLYTPWNKLFLRSRIEGLGLRYRDTFWEGLPFVLDFIRDVERVGVTERAYYHFIRERAESETSRWRPNMYEKREEEHGWMLDLYEHWDLSDDLESMEMVQRRYIERLVGCIENVCSPSCKLSHRERMALIATMIKSDRAQLAVRVARPRSRMMRTMLVPIKTKNAQLAFAEGKFISLVKGRSFKTFARLKANR